MPKQKQKLTVKQEAFAKAIALEDMTQADAYRAVYSTKNMTDDEIYTESSRVANSPKVSLRIAELRKECMTPKVMSARKRREKLTELAQSKDPAVAMKAIDLLNKMDGEYVQKVQAEVQTEVTVNIELVEE